MNSASAPEVSSDASCLDYQIGLNTIVYKKRKAKCFSNAQVVGDRECFFYTLSMSLVNKIPESWTKKGKKRSEPVGVRHRDFALVSGNQLPKACSFPIYTQEGEMRVDLDFLCSFKIKAEEVDQLKIFHEFVFSKVLGYAKPNLYRFNPEDSENQVLLAPVIRTRKADGEDYSTIVDWHLVQRIVNSRTLKLNERPTEELRMGFKFKVHDYVDAVLIPWYRPMDADKPITFALNKICEDMNPMSPFADSKNGYETFCDYFRSKYNLDILDKEQPLLAVGNTANRSKFNVLLPIYVDRKGQKHQSPDLDKAKRGTGQLLIPELCNIHPLPLTLWRQAVNLPAILHRLDSLYLADDLRRRIVEGIGLREVSESADWPPLEFDWLRIDDGDAKFDLVSKENSASLESTQREEINLRDAEIDTFNLKFNTRTSEVKPDEEMTSQTIEQPCNNFNKIPKELAKFNIESHSRKTLPILKEFSGLNQDQLAHEMCLDTKKSDINSIGPDLATTLKALTLADAQDAINLEVLETLGDSFLKFSVSTYLYCMSPGLNQGHLTSMKMEIICNDNLTQLGLAKRLPDHMVVGKFDPIDDWLPPCYSLLSQQERTVLFDKNDNELKLDELAKTTGSSAEGQAQINHLTQKVLSNKSVADCVEALIGAYLISPGGQRAALLFMNWLGLEVMPPSFDLEQDIQQCSSGQPHERWRWLSNPSDVQSYDPKVLAAIYKSARLDELESELQYTFKNKALLIQALVHGSSTRHTTIFGNYQRLEFLGDAVLDYLLTRYLYQDPKCREPGYLTDLRMALASNAFFAKLSTKHGFYKHLIHDSQPLDSTIKSFLQKHSKLISSNSDEALFANDDMDYPSILSDLFESIAGAVFLDSDLSLDQVWRVFYPIIGKHIEKYSQSEYPKTAIRRLYEEMPLNVRFRDVERKSDGTFESVVEIFGHGEFAGVGNSKHMAQSMAANRALEWLNSPETSAMTSSKKKKKKKKI